MAAGDGIDSRVPRALASLTGLSVGDGFGERFFISPGIVARRVRNRELPEGPWAVTDDTWMALSIVECLRRDGRIDPDALAHSFATHFHEGRGYGGGMRRLLRSVSRDGDWRHHAAALFDGQGSFGNGAAMRVAPLGAFFAADDPATVVEQARISATVTHTHPEGVAGAIAVAVAAALAWRHRESPLPVAEFVTAVADSTPASEVAGGLRHAASLPADTPVAHAAAVLGCGERISAVDTVPFCCWMAARERDYATALFETVSVGGDRNTTCAIVGGILGATGDDVVPADWLLHREPLPEWAFGD